MKTIKITANQKSNQQVLARAIISHKNFLIKHTQLTLIDIKLY